MKILIVSDTHRKNQNFFNVVRKQSPDMVIHCGDAEGCEDDLAQAAGCPLMIVLGNNDFFSCLPRELELELEGHKVWVTHGHNYYVSMGNENIKREAAAKGMDIVVYGHTHRPIVDRDGDITAVNPGSLSYPRQDGHKPSYVIMEVEKEKVHFTIEYI
ncbi:MAG: YfcE family phosphodiesterase [Lachnospiraceae bacterium]|nr:YfcE family phosphodiesterase [Lachnospiraceae bacterium]